MQHRLNIKKQYNDFISVKFFKISLTLFFAILKFVV